MGSQHEVLIVSIEEKRGVDADTKSKRDDHGVMCIIGSVWAGRSDPDRSDDARFATPTGAGWVGSGTEGGDLDRPERPNDWHGGLGECEIIDSRRGTQAIARSTFIGKTCSRVGCNRPHHAKGLCKACYCSEARQLKKQPGAIMTRPVCVVNGCNREQHAKEFCKAHYAQVRSKLNKRLRAKGRRRYWLWDVI